MTIRAALMLVAVALGAVLVGGGASRVEAQARAVRRPGVITLRGCDALREADVRAALDAELRGVGAAEGEALDLEIECTGEVAVVLSVPGSTIAPRGLDVSDVPARLRPRLVALAVAELLLVAALRSPDERERAPTEAETATEPGTEAALREVPGTADGAASSEPRSAPPQPARAPAAPLDATARSSGAPVRDEPDLSRADRAAAPERPPAAARETEELSPAHVLARPTEGPTATTRARAGRGALVRASLDGTTARPPLVAPLARASVRAFTQRGDVLAGGELLARIGPAAIGVHASVGPERGNALGALLPSLMLGIAELSILCLDHESVELCGAARVAVGRAAVDARAASMLTSARSSDAPFFEGALVVSSALVVAPVAIGIDLAVGWAEGLVAYADDLELVALAGPTLSVGVSLEVLP